MKIQRFEVPGLAQYSYVIADGGEAVVLDPIRDIDRYLAYATQEQLLITHVFETHIHADFASGAPALAEATGAELALSGHDRGERYVYAMPHRALTDSDRIAVGRLRLQPLAHAGPHARASQLPALRPGRGL